MCAPQGMGADEPVAGPSLVRCAMATLDPKSTPHTPFLHSHLSTWGHTRGRTERGLWWEVSWSYAILLKLLVSILEPCREVSGQQSHRGGFRAQEQLL